MSRITVERGVRIKLGGLATSLELFDETGKLLGHFIPVEDRSIYEGVECPISDEELERRKREESGRSLDEIMRDWERLP